MIEKHKPLTGTQIDPEEQLPDLPALARFYKKRSRDSDIIRKCKHMLIAGMPPGKVALLLRLPLEKVKSLHQASYNPRCRRLAKTNPYTNAKLALTSFQEGTTLADICTALSLPLFTVVQMLRAYDITDAAMAPKMPPYDDPLCIEYRRVCERKAVSKHTPIEIRVKPRKKKSPATA
ncbi:TPA: hypothetical protein QA377_003254 [Raoultella ornithinolytica]|nr:hypothetical protein [Raoultella ornithinolytica]